MLVLLQFISDAKQIKDNVFFSSLLLHYSEVIDGMGWDGIERQNKHCGLMVGGRISASLNKTENI